MSKLVRIVVVFCVLALAGGGGVLLVRGEGEHGEQACEHAESGDRALAGHDRADHGDAGAEAPGQSPLRELYRGPGESDGDTGCEGRDRPGHPESFADLARANSSRATRSLAPGTELRPGAYRAAVRQADQMTTVGGAWQPYGDTPLQGNNTDYDTTMGSTREGLPGLSGRVTSFARDTSGNIYAAASNGGVWESTDGGGSWHSIGDSLPTQVVSGLGWTSAGGGTLVVLTGDDAFGGDSVAGMGIYYTRDSGATWNHSAGVPDGVLGFKVAVDPTDPNVVYAGTGAGLYRSTDGGASFVNTNLPTGKGQTPDCSGQAPTVKGCFLANMVTDVVVQPAGGPGKTKGGAVMAAVGWRAGNAPNADGKPQSPGNGIYVSPTGAPGTFTNMDMAANATPNPPFGPDPLTQARIGRIRLGVADGPAQDHNIVYAIVEDAVKFNGGVTGLDANEPHVTSAVQSDVLNAVWVSTDFGKSWKELEGSSAIDADTTSGSALAPPTCKAPAVIAYCPGVQAWYNLWVQPDPTQQTAAGVPTRVLFGLEELWENNAASTPPTGLDGTTSVKFDVIGRYYANESCTLLNTGALPICPADIPNGLDTPKTTTHPDQHGAMFLPDGKGGVTFFSGNDGGVFAQHVGSGGDFTQGGWGNGANSGLHTLQPYDAEMAKDGTVYMGLQDNGEGKIEPSGKSYTVYGGDGFFTAVDPDDSSIAYEEYTGGDISVTTDGGKTWTDIHPSLTSSLFSTPFQMDPNDADHLMIGGREVYETTTGPGTSSSSWSKVFDLGTQKHPGDGSASSASDDPDNQLSAVDVLGQSDRTSISGPPTANFSYTGGADTVPGPATQAGVFTPGTYDDHPFTVGPNDGDSRANITLSWDDPTGQGLYDWDLYLFRKAKDGTLTQVASSASSNDPETISFPQPPPGDYVIRAQNFSAAGTYKVTVAFVPGTGKTAGSGAYPSAAYVGFCGFCDVITQGVPFGNGLATNVGGDKPGKTNSSDGWHIAAAKGLPRRYITSVRMDPADPRTVYVTEGGYGRKWAAPGALGESTEGVGTGHVFRSADAGQTFTDVSGNLPDVPSNWSVLHNGHLVVGTDVGVFESCDTNGTAYYRLGGGLPAAPISTLRFKPDDNNLMVAATFGRGVYTYRFASDDLKCPPKPGTTTAATQGTPCAATATGRVAARPSRHGVRLSLPKSRRGSSVDVYQVSHGRTILGERLVARFRHVERSFTWSGRANRRGRHASTGYYFIRVTGPRPRHGHAQVNRVVLRRTGKGFTPRPDYYLRGSCGVVASYKLERAVFGGRHNRALYAAYRLGHTADVQVSIYHGKKLVHDFGRRTSRPGRTYRLRFASRHLPRGDYTVVLSAVRKGQQVRISLVSQRI